MAVTSFEADPYLELARTKKGRVFRKQILRYGKFAHPQDPTITVDIDENIVDSIIKNFEGNVCDIVQIPLATDTNRHTEDPERNLGEVVALEKTSKGLYAHMDFRKSTEDVGSTILGASAYIHFNYADSKTGEKKGPTLLHVCATNRPYLTDLDGYEQVAATAADDSTNAVLLTPEEDEVDPLEELKAKLKADHGIDLDELTTKAEGATGDAVKTEDVEKMVATAVSTAVEASQKEQTKKLAAALGLTATEDKPPAPEIVTGAIEDLKKDNVSLSAQVEALRKKDAEKDVDAKIKTGHILPKQRDTMIDLRLTNPSGYESMLPDEPIVKLNAEEGVEEHTLPGGDKNLDEEIARLTGEEFDPDGDIFAKSS